jgi:hypothetical protein
MPSIITASQLRTVLGVSSSLYSDAYLDGIINSAEGILLPLLESYSNKIVGYQIENGTAIFTTQLPNQFVDNQTITIASTASAFNGTQTVTDTYLRPYAFSIATNEADLTYQPVIPAGTVYVSAKMLPRFTHLILTLKARPQLSAWKFSSQSPQLAVKLRVSISHQRLIEWADH